MVGSSALGGYYDNYDDECGFIGFSRPSGLSGALTTAFALVTHPARQTDSPKQCIVCFFAKRRLSVRHTGRRSIPRLLQTPS